MKSFTQQPVPVPPQVELPRDFPSVPQEIAERFPDAVSEWQRRLDEFWTRTNQAIQVAQQQTASQVNSSVVFNVDSFLVNVNGVAQPMFTIDSTGVKLGDVLVVSTVGRKVFIGQGEYSDPLTPFYVDTEGFFSLGDSLTWNPDTDTLTIDGVINATSGTIGGFEIGADYIRDVADTFGLSSTVTGGDDVRFFAGGTKVTAGFKVYESGKVVAETIGFGALASNGVAVQINGPLTLTGSTMRGFENAYELPLIVDVAYTAYRSIPSMAAGAASALVNLHHFRASQGTIGAGRAITTQTGFNAESSLIGATNNYGFRGQIAAAANRYNLYMDGTAANFLGGVLEMNAGGSVANAYLDFLNTWGSRWYGNGGTANEYLVVANDGSAGSATIHFDVVAGAGALRPLVFNMGGVATAFRINTDGTLRASSLAGVGTRNVVADASGNLSAP
jgi:hypothetical protein